MSFSVEIFPTKEDVLAASVLECLEHAEILRTIGDFYVDPDFQHTAQSIGPLYEEDIEQRVFENLNDAWYPPHQLRDHGHRNNTHEWHIWNDPWPFHVNQVRIGDCWLMAALMAIARRKDILEIVLPKRDYALFVDGRWQVIKIDFYFPQVDGFERFSRMPKKQLWVAMIEKAYAKVVGSFGGLNRARYPTDAFTCLTGADSKMVLVNKDTNTDELWEQFLKYYSRGNLLAASTNGVEDGSEEEKIYDACGMQSTHAYGILDFKEHEGKHRLIKLGNSTSIKWRGRFSELPVYEDEITSKFCWVDRYLCDERIVWMDIEDFVLFFCAIYVCDYQEGYTDYKMRQTIRKKNNDDTQILRLEVKERCEVKIRATRSGEKLNYETFLNIHKSTPTGDLIAFKHGVGNEMCTDLYLNPGVYFVIPIFRNSNYETELDWTITSSRSVYWSFVDCPFATYHRSFLDGLKNNGIVTREGEKDGVVFYTFTGQDSICLVVENIQKEGYLLVSGTLTSSSDTLDLYLCFYSPLEVAPMTCRLIGFAKATGNFSATSKIDLNVQYKNYSWIWGLFSRYPDYGNDLNEYFYLEDGQEEQSE